MSLTEAHSDSCQGLLVNFLTRYDQRISQQQAWMLVLTHKCKHCRASFAGLIKTSQFPKFLVDSQGGIHELCPNCAKEFLTFDTEAKEIDLTQELKDNGEVRRTIFGILVGELRHTQLKEGTRRTQSAPLVQGEVSRERKPRFIRKHPARRGLIAAGSR